MAEPLYAAQRLGGVKLRFEHDTGEDGALLTALAGDAELVGMPVTRVRYYF